MSARVKTKLQPFILLSAFLAVSASAQNFDSTLFGGHRALWDSIIHDFSIPQWYEDGKFGIFPHWGVMAVPGRDIFYGSDMYKKGEYMYDWHRQNFGDQKTFGYKEFIPRYKMDKFTPDAWADLFVQSGVKYVMPIAIYHDGVAQYASTVIKKFNLVNYPGACGKDVVKLLETAVRKRGLRFGVTNQYVENWSYYCHDTAFDTGDPANAELYNTGEGGPCAGDPDEYWADAKARASATFMNQWYNTVIEQIDMFQPDILYFDVAFGRSQYFDMTQKSILTKYLYAAAARQGKQVSINYKRGAMPTGSAVEDWEASAPRTTQPFFWQTDVPLAGDWIYGDPYNCKKPENVLRALIENCSRNGSLMLGIANAPDGTLPACIITTLQAMGTWLKQDSEAIYGTRPWKIDFEGPDTAVGVDGSHYKTTDYRYTANKTWTAVYACGMAWPGATMLLTALKQPMLDIASIDSMYLIGRGKVTCSQDAAGLKINLTGTAAPIANYPFVVKIFLKTPALDPYAKIEAENCSNKRLAGIKIKTCSEGGQCLDSARSNDWAAYPKVNFGAIGARSITGRVSTSTAATSTLASIEVHLDDPNGPLVGKIRGACPGGVNNYATLTCDLTAAATGVHDLFLVWNPGFRSYNLNWFQFTEGPVSTRPLLNGSTMHAGPADEKVKLYDLRGRLVAGGDKARATLNSGSAGGFSRGIYIRKATVGNVTLAAKLYVNSAATLNGRKFSF